MQLMATILALLCKDQRSLKSVVSLATVKQAWQNVRNMPDTF